VKRFDGSVEDEIGKSTIVAYVPVHMSRSTSVATDQSRLDDTLAYQYQRQMTKYVKLLIRTVSYRAQAHEGS
jgi:hypothetical protein